MWSPLLIQGCSRESISLLTATPLPNGAVLCKFSLSLGTNDAALPLLVECFGLSHVLSIIKTIVLLPVVLYRRYLCGHRRPRLQFPREKGISNDSSSDSFAFDGFFSFFSVGTLGKTKERDVSEKKKRERERALTRLIDIFVCVRANYLLHWVYFSQICTHLTE